MAEVPGARGAQPRNLGDRRLVRLELPADRSRATGRDHRAAGQPRLLRRLGAGARARPRFQRRGAARRRPAGRAPHPRLLAPALRRRPRGARADARSRGAPDNHRRCAAGGLLVSVPGRAGRPPPPGRSELPPPPHPRPRRWLPPGRRPPRPRRLSGDGAAGDRSPGRGLPAGASRADRPRLPARQPADDRAPDRHDPAHVPPAPRRGRPGPARRLRRSREPDARRRPRAPARARYRGCARRLAGPPRRRGPARDAARRRRRRPARRTARLLGPAPPGRDESRRPAAPG